MTTYKTPDVYVEEISLFPPSVAEVETAIPAFIGYTQKADKLTTNDLHMVPKRVSSLLDYQKYYGFGPAADISSVKLNDDNSFSSVSKNTDYFMYDALRMFYDNGGGDCYIVSVGLYGTTIDVGNDTTDLKGGLRAVEKADEPTILLFPDAVKMTADKLYGNLQTAALEQCKALGDRVALFDLLENDATGTTFRDKVTINNLKYGMAYTPWLKVSLPQTLSYRNLLDATTYATKIAKSGPTTLSSLTSDAQIQSLIADLENVIKDVDRIAKDTHDHLLTGTTLPNIRAKYQVKKGDFNSANTDGARSTALTAMVQFLYDIADEVDAWSKAGTGLKYVKMRDNISSAIDSTLRDTYFKVLSYETEVDAALAVAGYTLAAPVVVPTNTKWDATPGTPLTNIFGEAHPSLGLLTAVAELDKMKQMVTLLDDRFEEINSVFGKIISAAASFESTYDNSLYQSFPLYKNIINGINDSSSTMPPSGAIAGIIAATDRDRGVWKAPANVSLSSVIGPTNVFTAGELDALNIDVNAGKSINAIRAFVGKGTLVWGARTLAGNDNEWRYIPVRRFFNMVEESIKKSTYWAVFEPNSANTWVKVKGMIENYLTNKWKDGALVGAKPDEAFFVKIGLGTTMTAQDILNGYMNVEIGMAVVRPAEFIVLKFSHKLQQS